MGEPPVSPFTADFGDIALVKTGLIRHFAGMAAELSPEYIAILRRMSGAQKLRVASALYWSARKLKAAALRHQHPTWSEAEVQLKVKHIFLHATT